VWHLVEAARCAAAALAIDPRCDLAIFARGLVAAKRGDLERALPDLRRAAALKPGDGGILAELCRFAFAAGQELQEWVRKPLEDLPRVDPLTPPYRLPVASWHFSAGRLDRAAGEARVIESLCDEKSPVRIFAAWNLAMAGERDEAKRILRQLASVLQDTPYALYGSLSSFVLAALDGRDEAAVHVTTSLEDAGRWNEYIALMLAEGYAMLGRPSDAVRWLRTAVTRGFVNYPFLAERDPLLHAIRNDAGFQVLMGEVRGRWNALSL
jgi:tetratricopeptide (TPR) repeat protein